jgi:hypothetical protein
MCSTDIVGSKENEFASENKQSNKGYGEGGFGGSSGNVRHGR